MISSDASFLVQNTHLHLTLLRSFEILVNSHVRLAMSDSCFSCIAAPYLLASWISKLCKNLEDHLKMLHWHVLCRVGGKMWFFHHSPDGRHSLLGYPPSSINILTWLSFPVGLLIAYSIATKWSFTYFLRFSPSSYVDDLEHSSTTTTLGLSFLLLGRISNNVCAIFYEYHEFF